MLLQLRNSETHTEQNNLLRLHSHHPVAATPHTRVEWVGSSNYHVQQSIIFIIQTMQSTLPYLQRKIVFIFSRIKYHLKFSNETKPS